MKLDVKLFKYLIIFYHLLASCKFFILGTPGTRGFFSRVARSFGPKHPTTGGLPPPRNNIGF